MSKDPLEYLKHIRDESNYILSVIDNDLSKEEFINNETLKRAIVRSLEIIGEATKRIPRSVKEANKHIDWQSFSMYRDFIIHSYFEASVDRIWNIIKTRIPKLKKDFEEIKLL